MKDQQLDLFIADFADITPRGEQSTMEQPIFSLSHKTDLRIFKTDLGDTTLEVIPSAEGRATIKDKDVILYLLGQLTQAMNQGHALSRQMRVIPHDLLRFAQRGTGGRSYDLLMGAFTRLRGTTFRVQSKSKKHGRVFGLIDEVEIYSQDTKGRAMDMTVLLPEWILEAVEQRQVLRYNPDYLSLSSPMDRRLYEICRKHCGNQEGWYIRVDNLHAKFGDKLTDRKFVWWLKQSQKKNNLPDYEISTDGKMMWVGNRFVTGGTKGS